MGLESKRARWGLGFALLAVAACFIYLLVTGTIESRAYLREHRPSRGERAFPVTAVTVSSAALLVEALVLWRFLTSKWSSFRARTLVAFAVSFGGFGILMIGLHVHSPPYVTIHLLWLACLVVLTLGLVLVSTTVSLVRRADAKRRDSG